MAQDLRSRLARAAVKPGAGPVSGSTEHALVILLLIEIGLLVWLRKAFSRAHGG